MPRPVLGQAVLWFPPSLDRTRACVGFITRIGAANTHIYVGNVGMKEAVRHYTDPKLKLSADIRETGAWDFTPEYYELKTFKERLSSIEGQLAKLTADVARATTAKRATPMVAFNQLKKRAKEAGIEVYGKTRKDLETELKALPKAE